MGAFQDAPRVDANGYELTYHGSGLNITVMSQAGMLNVGIS